MTAIPKNAAPRSPWILGPWRDLLLIVLCPLVVIPLVMGAQEIWSAASITTFAVLFAMSHHLPGFIRAYGDRELFRRFRVRFLVAPVLLLALTIPTALAGYHSVIFITMLWGNWHYLAQAYGFGRIYDGRIGRTERIDARLDKALCIAWFVGTPILFSNMTIGFVEGAVKAGLPIPSADGMTLIRTVTKVVMAVVSVAWIVNAVKNQIRGTASSPVKISLLGTTMVYFWFIAAFPNNLFVAYALFEIFHDTQYLAIVWAINRNRVDKGQKFDGLSRFLFSPGGSRVLFYIGICVLYGLVDFGSKQAHSETFRDVMIGVFGASTILHYYFDGFIWRLRDASNSAALGVEGSATKAWFHRPWIRHAALWSIFVVPVSVCLVTESRRDESVRIEDQLMAALPDSWEPHYRVGLRLAQERKFDEARPHFDRALELLPGNADTHVAIAGMHLLQNELEQALPHYEAAIEFDRHHRNAHFFFGRVLSELGRYDEAQNELETAWRLDNGKDPDVPYWVGMNLRRNKKPREARAWHTRALEIHPGHQGAQQELRTLAR